jgi:hypothetical protein
MQDDEPIVSDMFQTELLRGQPLRPVVIIQGNDLPK